MNTLLSWTLFLMLLPPPPLLHLPAPPPRSRLTWNATPARYCECLCVFICVSTGNVLRVPVCVDMCFYCQAAQGAFVLICVSTGKVLRVPLCVCTFVFFSFLVSGPRVFLPCIRVLLWCRTPILAISRTSHLYCSSTTPAACCDTSCACTTYYYMCTAYYYTLRHM